MKSESNQPLSGPAYWRSLDEKAATPEFKEWLHREFPDGAAEIEGVNRRHFLKLMAASFSLAGLGMSGCRQPRTHVLPYAKQPEHLIQGVPSFFSTAVPRSWGHQPVIVESHQGRPTKIEGNPSHPRTKGGTDAFTQASVLDLYDPDRLKGSRRGSKRLRKEELLDAITDLGLRLERSGGVGFAVLAEPSFSPVRNGLIAGLIAANPGLLWAEYEPIEHHALEQSTLEYAAKALRPVYHLENAKRVLALDCDFLGLEPDSVGNNKAYAKARKVRSTKDAARMNRLYAAESNLTLTGAAADHRLRASTVEVEAIVALVARLVFDQLGIQSALKGSLDRMAQLANPFADWVEACVDDLLKHRGSAAVLAGNHLSQVSQLLVVLINQALEAEGKTVSYLDATLPYRAKGMEALVAAMKQGAIKTLIILGGNPAYDAPGDSNFELFVKTVPEVIRYTHHDDETATLAGLTIAASHYLESWGDGITYEGHYVPVQPLIEPLYDTISEVELLARIARKAITDPYTLTRQSASKVDSVLEAPHEFSAFLAEGIFSKPVLKDVRAETGKLVEAVALLLANATPGQAPDASRLELRLIPSYHTYDGRSANNGWLMECPEPLTKLTWDNAILISPRLAKDLEESTGYAFFPGSSLLNELGAVQRNQAIFKRGKQEAWVAQIKVGERMVEGPVHVQMGLADYTVVIAKGFGRSTGRIASGAGFDVYPLTQGSASGVLSAASLTLTGDTYPLANTQEHWSIEGREILREGSVEDYIKKPDYVSGIGIESHSPPVYGKDKDKPIEYKAVETPRGGGMYDPPNFEFKDRFHPTDPNATWAPQQWGMTIDLNTCTGCNACVVACQSENNIPIVGKDQVRRGREMHWIRLDRYFSSMDPDKTEIPSDVQVSFQGMACTHCELAPCETVCPVNATVHDEQGLNVMAYNRCVGTRYCANNCPYKVRRFNFFDWNKKEIGTFYQGPLAANYEPETLKMQRNPDVTVRMRGVMEKCTYCVQRIESAKIRQKSLARDSDRVKVKDGVIKTACQQVCPTEAIAFGDITDTSSEVYKNKDSDLNYSVLGYLNIRPRTTYLAKLRNPNPEMPLRYRYTLPFSRMEYEAKGNKGDSYDSHASHKAATGH